MFAFPPRIFFLALTPHQAPSERVVERIVRVPVPTKPGQMEGREGEESSTHLLREAIVAFTGSSCHSLLALLCYFCMPFGVLPLIVGNFQHMNHNIK